MNVTPTEPMYRAMSALVDVSVGAEPLTIETSPAANKRREDRIAFMDVLHRIVAMSMREGARRIMEERGMPTAPAPMKGNG